MWCLLVLTVLLADDTVAGAVEGSENATDPRWISEYMPGLLGSLKYGEDESSTTECKRHGLLYKRHFSNRTLWAVTMHDASALHWDNLVTGGTIHFGSFDACMSIHVPEYSLTGRYCFVKMGLRPVGATPRFFNYTEDAQVTHPGPLESIWALFQETADPRIAKKDDMKFALCIPSGCSQNDLRATLVSQLLPTLRAEGLDVSVELGERACVVQQDETKFDFPALVYLSVFGLLFFTVALVSLVHGYLMSEERQLKFNQCWLSTFSLLNSGRKLMQVEGPPDLHFLSGMKVLSMFLIIFGHRYLTMLYVPTVNVTELEKKYNDFMEMLLFNGPLIVNTFLMLSGFFTYFKVLNDIEKGRGVNIPLYLYYRWMRVTVVYATVIFFSALILPHYISGPGWKVEGLMRYDTCRRNWWSHLLYINNYYRADEECTLPGWYLAVDMQLFVVAVLLGFCVSKWKVVEIPLLASFLTFSIAIPAIVTYIAGYPPILKFYLNYIHRYWKADDYVNAYTKTHMRAAPYVMGMITAKIYFKLKEKKFQFSKPVLFLMAVTAFVLAQGTLFSAWPFFQSVVNPSRLVSALYSSFSKVVWALSMCLFVLGHSLGGLGFPSNSLASRLYVPFNRLTLLALLIHPIVQIHMFLGLRQPLFISGWVIFWSAAGDIATSYVLSAFMFLFIEAPMTSLNDHILRKLFVRTK
uniref:Nose resistant to fluoxetine protein 6 n=1 Tax=Lygus hesperus TaxID=30085 RepID=A0A146LYJ6_LYGHE